MVDLDVSVPMLIDEISFDDPKKLPDSDIQSSFLEQFTLQTIRNAFAGFDVTAGQKSVARAFGVRQQKVSLVFDHSSSDQVNSVCFHRETLTDHTALHS